MLHVMSNFNSLKMCVYVFVYICYVQLYILKFESSNKVESWKSQIFFYYYFGVSDVNSDKKLMSLKAAMQTASWLATPQKNRDMHCDTNGDGENATATQLET